MYPGPGTRTSASSCRGSSRHCATGATRSSGPSSIAARRQAPLRRARQAGQGCRAFRPDVVYAHFLVPAGLVAAQASRAPLVVTAHGQDVARAAGNAVIRRATRSVCRRAAAVVAVSAYLRDELERAVPEARGKTDVVDCGVDVERFRVVPAPDAPASYLFVGSLIERKNVVRLADAFARLGDGEATLIVLGDGPLRASLEGRRGVRLVGAVPSQPGESTSPPRESSANRAWWSRSGRRCSRRWPWAGRSWRQRSAARPSS